MKKKLFSLMLLIMILSGFLAAQSDQEAFEKAKILIFDKQWQAALKKLDDMIVAYPASQYFASALFYRAKCQEELGVGKPALESYEKYVKIKPDSALVEDALISVIDLSAALFEAGEKAYLQKIQNLLKHENKVVSYYAAFKLSYLPDRQAASRALSVLQTILDREKDAELRDRAKIAIMRIDPTRLKGMAGPQKSTTGKTLKIRIFDRKDKKAEVSLNIPLALADLALKSLGAEERRALKKEGYNVDQLLEQLLGTGMKIDIHDEDSDIQIWVE
jgi:tetratricopeptide (TPR) repeat protein